MYVKFSEDSEGKKRKSPFSTTTLSFDACPVYLCSFHCMFLPRNALKCLRGLGIACRSSVHLSVRLSVTLVICDHIGWKSRKLIARTISPTPSVLVAERRSTYSQGNMEKFRGNLKWGREKVACWRTKAAISLKRVKIEEKLLWTAYRNSPTLNALSNGTIPDPIRPPLPQNWGFATPTQNCNLKFRANECW